MRLCEAACREGGCPDAHSPGEESIAVPVDGVLVERDVTCVAQLLHLAAREFVRTEIPETEMVVASSCCQRVSLADQRLA